MRSDERFNYPLGVATFVGFILVNLAFWRFFFAPTHGVMKLFTPMYGLSIVAFLLFCIICLSDIFELNNTQISLGRGMLLSLASLALFYLVYYGFFWNFLGRFGVTYLSPQSIIRAGGTGAEIWNARENASTAITYLATALIFVTLVWDSGLRSWPWDGVTRPVRGWSRFFAVSFIAAILYTVFFHPHVTALFVPKQSFAGVEPWWEDLAMTSSAFFHIGWMMMAVAVLVLCRNSFEDRPFSLVPEGHGKAWARLALALGLAVGLGFVIFYLLEAVMTYYWDEPFLGGNYTDDPRFRHLDVAEIATFAIAASYLWKLYFGNWPRRFPILINYAARLAIVLLLTGGFWFFYYSDSLGPGFVDRVPGIGNIDDTALCWGIMTVVLLLVHDRLFAGWPLRRRDPTHD
jgi:hypothetical protein